MGRYVVEPIRTNSYSHSRFININLGVLYNTFVTNKANDQLNCSLQLTQIAMVMRPTWGTPRSCRPQMGPMLASWTLLSGYLHGDLPVSEEYNKPDAS